VKLETGAEKEVKFHYFPAGT